ncbi:hypothetical protein [Cohaesibacter haloalkalitolerans]|uniref:hypothetical protein n=1 Tax=Cohaesibacter haloalkalitolerans TaxID=1162980 RepID=UPI000E654C86|nr:hypothetical protein [Cohaesibacter haloalkalitolerans]
MMEPAWTATEWAALGDVLSGVGTVIGALAVIGAAYLASNTFDSWRKQTLSQRRIEQAERILTATYKVRRGLSLVRAPMLWGYEQQKAEDYLREKGELPGDEAGKKKMTIAQLYFTRLNAVMDDRKLLEECQPMARALFGEKLELALEALNHQFQRVNAAVQAQYRFEENTDRKFRESIEAVLWEGYPTPKENELDREIDEQVATIEKHCVPVLRLEN